MKNINILKLKEKALEKTKNIKTLLSFSKKEKSNEEKKEVQSESLPTFSDLDELKNKVELEESQETETKKEEKLNSEALNKKAEEDIFKGIIKEEKKLTISGINEEEEKGSILKNEKNEKLPKILKIINKILLSLFAIVVAIIIGIYLFFVFLLDNQNSIFGLFGYQTISSKGQEVKMTMVSKDKNIESIKKNIENYIGKAPNKIYLKSSEFQELNEELKETILLYYDENTGKIKENAKQIELEKIFLENKELQVLKKSFTKEHIINGLVEDRIYWKEVYQDLIEVTNNAFKYNEVLEYIKYNNFSVNENGEIVVSGIVTDPSGKVFSQLISLVNAINESEYFYGAEINTFSKNTNPDENIGGMVSPINLKFFYKK